MNYRYASVDVAPLVRCVDQRGGPAACGFGFHSNTAERRAYYRAKKAGHLTVWQADRLAFALLGLHPAEVWTDAWHFDD